MKFNIPIMSLLRSWVSIFRRSKRSNIVIAQLHPTICFTPYLDHEADITTYEFYVDGVLVETREGMRGTFNEFTNDEILSYTTQGSSVKVAMSTRRL